MIKSQMDGRGKGASGDEKWQNSPLSREQIDAVREFDTCTVGDATTFKVRIRNGGYTQPGLRCFTDAIQEHQH